MKHNFDEIIPRRGTNSVKWDESADDRMLPLWIADMDFAVCPKIVETLRRRIEHPIFGYTYVPESYYEAIVRWNRRRHNWEVDPHRVIYTTGVVPAVSAVIRSQTLPGDKVLIQTPDYNCFFSSIRNQGCVIEESPLIYNNGTYSIDFDDFERRCVDPRTRVFLLCNPHNPAGRVWSREELTRMGEICLRYGVFVLADEIHCELTMPGYEYTPFASISREFADNCAVCIAPTKAFNIAGLQIANIVVPNAKHFERVDRAINIHENCDVNPFGVLALQTAYNECEDWLDELRQYLWDNYQFLCKYFADNMPGLQVTRLEGTYLVWVNISATRKTALELCQHLRKTQHLWLNEGEMYGETAGRNFVRINIACPRKQLEEALRRLNNGLNTII